MSRETRLKLTRLLAFLAVIALTVFIYSIRDRAAEFEQYGYIGIFILSFMAYATIVLPAPGVAIIAAMGAVFNPLWIGVIAGAGAACGEAVGYIAGYSGQGIVEKAKIYEQLERFTKKFGPLAVLVMSAIPNPLFDFAGAAAGALKMPVIHFFLACWAGETVKMLIFAYGGASLLELIG
jgi:uncharacterized membrane protein YdjX (TVP38/TMEM64 family)